MMYHWAGRQLGGGRKPLSDSRHVALQEELRGFADHMGSVGFQKSAAQLINMAAKSPTVILGVEHEPERCYRLLIADYLTLQGVSVIHLLDPGVRRAHHLSAAVRRESAELVYDRVVSREPA